MKQTHPKPTVTIDGVKHASVTYTRPGGTTRLTDVTYAGERALSLVSPGWSAGDTVEHSAVLNPTTSLETVAVRSTHPMSETNREFLRLSVTIAAP